RSSTYTMAGRLHTLPAMRTTYLILTLILLLSAPIVCVAASPQEGVNPRGVVESAAITGVDQKDVSKEILDAIQKLVGERFDQQTADDLVGRIQDDLPTFIATVRLASGSQADKVKVLFSVEKS